jgi:hypothetical protein
VFLFAFTPFVRDSLTLDLTKFQDDGKSLLGGGASSNSSRSVGGSVGAGINSRGKNRPAGVVGGATSKSPGDREPTKKRRRGVGGAQDDHDVVDAEEEEEKRRRRAKRWSKASPVDYDDDRSDGNSP